MLGLCGQLKKVIRMKCSRIPTSFCALAIFLGVIVAVSAPARANDFTMPFGGKAASQSEATRFVAPGEASLTHLSAISGYMWASAIEHHEGHFGLGGNIGWRPTPRVGGMRDDDDGGWRHHDDDGEDDDDHGGKTAVPEPSTALLVFSGISALAGWKLRRRIQEGSSTI